MTWDGAPVRRSSCRGAVAAVRARDRRPRAARSPSAGPAGGWTHRCPRLGRRGSPATPPRHHLKVATSVREERYPLANSVRDRTSTENNRANSWSADGRHAADDRRRGMRSRVPPASGLIHRRCARLVRLHARTCQQPPARLGGERSAGASLRRRLEHQGWTSRHGRRTPSPARRALGTTSLLRAAC